MLFLFFCAICKQFFTSRPILWLINIDCGTNPSELQFHDDIKCLRGQWIKWQAPNIALLFPNVLSVNL